MKLSVTSKVEESFGILQLAGPLTLSPSLSSLRDATRQILSSGKLAGLILAMSGVTKVDSAGLGELTIVYTFASRQSCPIRLVGVSASLHKMLEMTRLDELLLAADDLMSAKSQLRGR
ncbi:MAG TPA: STAS domain-containing protein [Bryobacteraceae bacterium]|nr:STAS domain-containing protein [Bryobacteraceae bacterium]